jgi:monofunctional biosynthetic peptidoglycan transglycosylase
MAENLALSSERGERRSRVRRRSTLWRALRGVLVAALVLAALPLVLLPLYALIDPPVSAVMLWKRLGGAPINKQWADLEAISPELVRAVLSSEDARFCEHSGIDWVEMHKAMDDDSGRPRGASTITMQTVKNLFLWTQRSWIRKALEFPLALYAELVLSKKRIMEIYLNIAELGEGVYGAAAASHLYFGVPPSKLSSAQAARLAAILPAPLERNAAKPGRQTRAAARRIAGRAAKSGPYVGCVLND